MSGISGTYGDELAGAASDEQRWQLLGAVQRVIRAQQAVQDARDALDRQYEAHLDARDRPGTLNRFARAEVADYQQLNAIRHDLEELRSTRRRFRREAQKEIAALELAGRLALSRAGLGDFDEIEARQVRPADEDVIDLAYLEYAEHELALAERELAEIRRAAQEPRLALPAATDPRTAAADRPAAAAEPVELSFEGIEELEVWAGPPPLPRRKLPKRKRPTPATVTFAKLPRLREADEPSTVWRMWSNG